MADDDDDDDDDDDGDDEEKEKCSWRRSLKSEAECRSLKKKSSSENVSVASCCSFLSAAREMND